MFRLIKMFARYISRLIQAPLITGIYVISMLIIFQPSSVGKEYLSLESLSAMIMEPLKELPLLESFFKSISPEAVPIMNIISAGCFFIMTISVYFIVIKSLKIQYSMIDKNTRCSLRFLFIRRYIKYIKPIIISIVIKTLMNKALQSEEILSIFEITQEEAITYVKYGLYILSLGIVTYALPICVSNFERVYLYKLQASYDKKSGRIGPRPSYTPKNYSKNVSSGSFASSSSSSSGSSFVSLGSSFSGTSSNSRDDYYDDYNHSKSYQNRNFDDDFDVVNNTSFNNGFNEVGNSNYDYNSDYYNYYNKNDDGYYGDTSYLTMNKNDDGYYGDTSYLTMNNNSYDYSSNYDSYSSSYDDDSYGSSYGSSYDDDSYGYGSSYNNDYF